MRLELRIFSSLFSLFYSFSSFRLYFWLIKYHLVYLDLIVFNRAKARFHPLLITKVSSNGQAGVSGGSELVVLCCRQILINRSKITVIWFKPKLYGKQCLCISVVPLGRIFPVSSYPRQLGLNCPRIIYFVTNLDKHKTFLPPNHCWFISPSLSNIWQRADFKAEDTAYHDDGRRLRK